MQAPLIAYSHTDDQSDLLSVTAIGGQFYCSSSEDLSDSLFDCTIYTTKTKIVSVASVTERNLAVLELGANKNEVCVKLLTRAAWIHSWEESPVLQRFDRGDKSAAHIDILGDLIVSVDPQKKLLIVINYTTNKRETYAVDMMKKPYGVNMLSETLILLSDHHSHTVTKLKLQPGGHYDIMWTCEGIIQPSGICRDSRGLVYVASYTKNTIYILSPNGKCLELRKQKLNLLIRPI